MLAVDYDRLPLQQWLTRIGATAFEDAYGVQAQFAPLSQTQASIRALPDHGVIQVTGADAVKFLHAQLTNDLEKLPETDWRWFAYCNAKGRMQLSAAGFRRGETISLICSRPLAAPLAKRLGMFVMRAKAKVQDSSSAHEIYGLSGDCSGLLLALGADSRAASQRINFEGESLDLLRMQALGATENSSERSHSRYLVLAPAGSQLWTKALSLGLAPGASNAWRTFEAQAATARIVPATYELFVPQMLNYESIGGVDFKKGCYPGQEVVARSQYLGKLKRRMFVGIFECSPVSSNSFEPQPAQDVWSATAIHPGLEGEPPENMTSASIVAQKEPCGIVVLAGPTERGYRVLFESQVNAVEQGRVGLCDASGNWHPLIVQALPYPLLEI